MMLSEPVFFVAVTHSQGISEAKVLLLSPPQQFWQKKNIKTHSFTMGARQKPVPAAGKKPAAKKAANSKKPAGAKAAKAAAGLKKPAAKAIKKPGKSKYEIRDLTEGEKKIFEDYEVQEYNKRFKSYGYGKVSPRRTPASDSEGQ